MFLFLRGLKLSFHRKPKLHDDEKEEDKECEVELEPSTAMTVRRQRLETRLNSNGLNLFLSFIFRQVIAIWVYI